MASVKDILNFTPQHIYSLSRKELAKTVSILSSAGNKRLKRFSKKKITTPATAYIKKHGGKFSVAGKNIQELREEFERVKGFLTSETSTARGFNKWESKMAKTLKENTGIDYNSLTETQKRTFWDAYAKLEENDSANVYGVKYRESVNTIYDAIKSGELKRKNIDDWVKDISESIYENESMDFLKKSSPFNVVSENPFTGGVNV